ncbi:MAG: SUMF1/EgtB/PvdO family nonheme iron enzyme [Planctomycetes bacterium]|nr:SUMF1/EgtB/PvdO family nonheme iron enzyme [Planctomycetota bacterium]
MKKKTASTVPDVVPQPRHALLLGIGDYGGRLPRLDAPPLDVDRLATLLKREKTGEWLTFVPHEDGWARAASLTRRIRALLEGAGSRLLYFAGHAEANERGVWLSTPDGEDGREGVSFRDILSLVFGSKAEQVLVVLDCCYAGGAAEHAQAAYAQEVGRAIAGEKKGPELCVFAASSPFDLAWEKQEHGVFTDALCHGLEEAVDVHGRVRIGALQDYLEDRFSAKPRWPAPYFWTGPQSRQMIVTWGTPKPRATPAGRFHGEAEREYLDALVQKHKLLELSGLGVQKAVEVQMEKVYVTLRTSEAVEAGKRKKPTVRRVALSRLLPKSPRLAVIGAPGCGKSTLLKHVALVLAYAKRNPGSGAADQELGLAGPETQLPVPVLFEARALGAALSRAKGKPVPFAGHLAEFLRGPKRRALAPASIEERLQAGTLLLLVDGLDEVTAPGLRQRVLETVRDVAAHFTRTRIVVTCRTRAFEKLRGWTGFDVRRVDDFDEADVRNFLTRWSQALPFPGAREAVAAELCDRILGTRALRQLASNPLLLTMMGMVRYGVGQLPRDRDQLYERCCEYLLVARSRDTDADNIRSGVWLPERDRWAACEEIAWALMTDDKGRGRLSTSEARAILKRCVDWEGVGRQPSRALLDETLEWLELRAGVLAKDAEEAWGFRHRTFQEFLAARRLKGIGGTDCWPELRPRLSGASSVDWHEVYLLLVRLLPAPQRAALLERIVADAGGAIPKEQAVALVEQALGEAGRAGLKPELTKRIRTLTRSVLRILEDRSQAADLGTRIEVAEALGRFGDPRLGRSPTDIPLVQVPAGTFRMGTTRGGDDVERPQHFVEVALFRIGRFPITNGQYHAFVVATGHRPPEPEYSIGKHRAWKAGSPPGDRLTHPVTGVSWQDTVAYCHWLSDATGSAFRLPTEAEWEKAARGTDGRQYPWGYGWRKGLANDKSSLLEATTPVGVFPAGASPYGCLDMAGNVWEWCSSLRQPYPYDGCDGREDITAAGARVLRGGACFYDGLFVRAAYRFGLVPGGRNAYVGFRVVVGAGV